MLEGEKEVKRCPSVLSKSQYHLAVSWKILLQVVSAHYVCDHVIVMWFDVGVLQDSLLELGTKEDILNGLLVAIESQVYVCYLSLSLSLLHFEKWPSSLSLVKMSAIQYWYNIRTTVHLLDTFEEVEQVSY